ncbi:ccch zinc finger protein [Ophiostoma piceae UAMH 11346]|uniref:Ccch zinc finger protein n=1 Tax=Ophiostoma piceae (strain UAMH 11346) TaxID=1262450 RepID=S3C0E5_OPHP1|nr:ccch zinc finger protein [Ophiostoma piceae UAMH 11346]
MSSEDQQLLARISQLAGQINRHKNQLAGVNSVPAPQYPSSSSAYYHATPSTRPSPYQRPAFAPRGAPAGVRGRGYGSSYRVKKATPFRNRTLVLNGASDGGSESASNSDNADGNSASKTGPSWVSRTDRHMQLINSDVYEKDSQARAKAIEQTRLQKQKQRDHHERSKLRNHFSHLASSGTTPATRAAAASNSLQSTYQVFVADIPFYIAKNGSKLVKVPGDPNPPSATPKTAIIGGVKFYRSKNGNLYRHGVVKAQRRTGNIKKIDELCKTFSTTGSCSKGPRCRYIHDAAKVAACKDFLLKGDCPHGNDCDLSHDLTPERTPFCLHYAKGNCTNSNCPYTHSQVSAGALVCRPFGLYGYCDQGADCTERHVLFECPDFSNTGFVGADDDADGDVDFVTQKDYIGF